jgi:hypothetical protein
MPNPGWSRRRFIKSAGAGGLGLLAIPALTAARSQPRAKPGVNPGASLLTPSAVQPARLGVFCEPQPPEHGFYQSLQHFEEEIGREIRIYRSYRSWGAELETPPITSLLKRATPPHLYFTVHSFRDSKGNDCIPWADIAGGTYDADIDAYAAELKKFTAKTPVYMCFHHEMENEEGPPPTNCGTPDEFQAAYWHFRDRIQNVKGVTGLTWVITYMGNTFRGKHGGPERWWPDNPPAGLLADQLMGVDVYNRNLCHGKGWRKFDYLIQNPWIFATQVGRPLFIGECGTVEADECGGTGKHGVKKAKWFEQALEYMRDTAPALGYVPLDAFCYSHVLGFNDGSYRIDTSPESQDSFTALANDPFFAKN